MDRFSKYNPKATFLYFLCIIILTVTVNNPVFLSVGFISAFIYKLKIKGAGAFSYLLKFILPVVLLTAIFNFAFTHYGETVLLNIFDMSFTFEGLFYGFSQGIMLAGVILWFSAYNEVVTSERLLAVFGSAMPNTALVFSMVLGFIPRLRQNAEQISDARFLIDNDGSRLKKSLKSFSALVTMTLEDSIDLADSMKARGFGAGRKVYSKYRFCIKDLILILFILICTLITIVHILAGNTGFIYEPVIIVSGVNVFALIPYTLLMLAPVIIDFTEDMKWRILKQKA